MDVAVVTIGRNEGERLAASLRSTVGKGRPVIYVDSASDDRSPELAGSLGAHVVVIPPDGRLSAARSRNAGFEAAKTLVPGLKYVQFVDGDSTIEERWIDRARTFLRANDDVALVAGAVRERDPDRSVYHRMCHLEWAAPPGDAASLGGIFMARAEDFAAVGGFDPGVSAGEEGELAAKLRARSRRIVRLPDPMAVHDAGPLDFAKWWRRAVRGGVAYALAARRGDPRAQKQVRSFLLFGAALPLLALFAAAAAPFAPRALLPALLAAAVLAIAVYPALAWRIARGRRAAGGDAEDSRLYARYTVLAKFPQFLGWLGRRGGTGDGA